jgi:diacylglycerol kinase family enzyme
MDVIVNTTAHRFAARPELLDQVRRVVGHRARLHATSTLAELEQAAARIAAEGSALVALTGGDGTFMAGLTALARAFGERPLPKIALIAGGTVATVARNWSPRAEPAALIDRVLTEGPGVRTTTRPTLRVVGDGGASGDRLGFIFGTGLVAAFFDLYYAAGGRGYGAAARIVARIFAESFVGGAYARRVLEPLACSLEADGELLAPRAWSLVCASVVPNLGLHMLVNYRAGEDLARPHLVASALGPRSLGPRMPLVLAGKSIGGGDHFDGLVRSFTVRFGADAGPYVLDGEVLRAREVEVRAGPPIRVVG